jgi:hypothetical protein
MFKSKKKWVSLDEVEWRFLLYALNSFRSSLIAEGRYTDVVDEVILKVINTPVQKIKIAG